MKTILTLVFAFLSFAAFAQNCPDFERLMREGDAAKDYEVAFNKYDAADAVACTEADRSKARRKKSELFKKINALREKAEVAEADAKRSARLAEEAAQKIKEEQEKTLAEQGKTLAERNKALEALRLNKLMSDSVAQATSQVQKANESVASLIRMNDLEELGNIALKKEDYAAALKHFNGTLLMIEEMSEQDTSLSTKAELIRSRIDLLKEQWAKVQLFESLLAEGDSLKNLGAKNLSGAFERYLIAGTFDLKRDRVLAGLDAVEAQFQLERSVAKRLPKKDYLDLLISTTKAFEFTGNQIAYNQRIKTIGRLPYVDFSQIQDEQIRSLTLKDQRSFSRRVSFFVGMRYRFGQQSNKPILTATLRKNVLDNAYRSVSVPVEKLKADLEPNIDFSVNFKVSDKISIGAGFNFRQNKDRNYGSISGVYGDWNVVGADSTFLVGFTGMDQLYDGPTDDFEGQTNFYANIYVDVLKFLKIRGPFNIQFFTGLEYNSNQDIYASVRFSNYDFNNQVEYFGTSRIKISYPCLTDFTLDSGGYSSVDFFWDDYYYNDTYYTSGTSSSRELELSLGLRFTFEPFRAFKNIGLFNEISFRQLLPGLFQPRKEFNIADEIKSKQAGKLSDPTTEIDELYFSEIKRLYDIDISLDTRRRQLLYAWNLNAGIYYRF